jgi:phage tail-like protein
MDTQQPPSSYLGYLPAVFRQDPWVGQFLLAFEAMLSGLDGSGGLPVPGGLPGLETTIGRLAGYFDPATTDAEFLPWLAGWVSLTLRADWDETTRRGFIAQIVPLYRLRGTPAGLKQMLTLYTGEPVQIYDAFDSPPYFFEVKLTLSEADPALLQAKQQIARAIIDQEKPAHTFYSLQVAVPSMRLVSQARHERENAPLLILGTNTLLGTSIPTL